MMQCFMMFRTNNEWYSMKGICPELSDNGPAYGGEFGLM